MTDEITIGPMGPMAEATGVPHRPPKREVSDETRRRIIEAARGLLTEGNIGAFSMEAVARLAGLSRLTIYYQFGSKRALLEALYDDIAARSAVMELPNLFREPDAVEALRRFVGIFATFWGGDRVLIRKLRALAALDPDFQAAVQRDQWRRLGLGTILRRLADDGRVAAPVSEATADLLSSLTSFETFDAMAGESTDVEQVRGVIEDACFRLLGLKKD